MKIEDTSGREILTFDDWANLYDTPRERRKWKEHRSAWSVADFVINHDGVAQLQARLADAIGQSITVDRVVPEFEQRFDQYGHGRVHDLGVFGQAADGRSVFVGVEAKVDETFGATVHDAYLQAKAKQITGKSTNAPLRIEQLLALHFAEPDPSMFDVRYQLLYATAGTLAANADISVMYVVVFKTPLYDESIGANNYRDYIHFVNKVGGMPVSLTEKGVVAHTLNLDGRALLCLHEYFELPTG
jgi:hypothetical protein